MGLKARHSATHLTQHSYQIKMTTGFGMILFLCRGQTESAVWSSLIGRKFYFRVVLGKLIMQ